MHKFLLSPAAWSFSETPRSYMLHENRRLDRRERPYKHPFYRKIGAKDRGLRYRQTERERKELKICMCL